MAGKLLIIEDDREISDLLQTLLQMEGYEVETSGDGGEGLERALRAPLMPSSWTLCSQHWMGSRCSANPSTGQIHPSNDADSPGR